MIDIMEDQKSEALIKDEEIIQEQPSEEVIVRSREPKIEWIKEMKQKLLSKTR